MEDVANEQLAWLTLLRQPILGAAGVRVLVQAFGTAAAALDARGPRWRELGIAAATPDAAARGLISRGIERDSCWLAQGRGRRLFRCTDADWPAMLERITDPPAALFVCGDAGALWQPQVAVVGSRQATRGGLEHAATFAGAFARRGLAVTSGFARGIDTAAHLAALAAGGITVAVCGTGLDVEYPRGSSPLGDAIAERGCRVSEVGTGAPPLAVHFPRRNRLIAALSLGTLVIEAGLRSGSLITARLAAEQGREVFALPGSILNPQARGCHALIRDGARLVESAEEVCEALLPMAAELAAAIRERLRDGCADPSRRAGRETLRGQERDASSEYAGPHEPGSADTRYRHRDDDGRRAAPAGADPATRVPGRPSSASETSVSPGLDPVLAALGFDPVGLDSLLGRLDLDTSTLNSRLLTLELAGHVEALPGGQYVRLR